MLHSCDYKKQRINLTGDLINKKINVFSVLVGINGVGKSRLLSAIAINAANLDRLPTSVKNERLDDVAASINGDYSKEFSTIIASSVSPFDKFPVIKRNSKSLTNYKYLGVRGISGENIGFAHTSRVVGSLLKTILNEKNKLSIIRNIFSYLGYSDFVVFEIKLSSEYLRIKKQLFKIFNERYFVKNNEFLLNKDLSLNEIIEKLRNDLLDDNTSFLIQEDKNNKSKEFLIKELKLNQNFLKLLEDINSLGFEFYRDYINFDKLFELNNSFEIQVSSDGFYSESLTKREINYLSKHIDSLILNGVFVLKKFKIRKKSQKRFINISSASSGEQSVMISLLGIASYIKNNSLILIDEPEICLHPSWQEKYIGLLMDCFSFYSGCHFIIATHSPQIVSNLSLENCFVINMTDNETYPSENFHKESADFQLAELFGAPGYKNQYLLKKITLILAEISSGVKINEEQKISIQKDINKNEKLLDKKDPVYRLMMILKNSIKINS